MRKKIVAGNWKMNKTLQEGIELAKEVNSKVKAANAKDVKVIIGTPFIHLAEVSKMVDPAVIAVSAQNCATEVSGAYTGEVSWPQQEAGMSFSVTLKEEATMEKPMKSWSRRYNVLWKITWM